MSGRDGGKNKDAGDKKTEKDSKGSCGTKSCDKAACGGGKKDTKK